jgi:signal transduction histidine kinase
VNEEEPSFRERLGGRWALSLKAFLITAPLIVFAITIVSAQSWSQAVAWSAASIVAMVVLGAWTYLLHRTVFRNRATSPLPVSVVIVCAVIAGMIFVAIASLVGFLLGLPAEEGPWGRIVPTVLIATWWSITLSLMLEASDRFRRERTILIDRAIQQQVAAAQEAEVAARIKESIRNDINAELAGAQASLMRRLDEIEAHADVSYAVVADELRDTAQTAVRPLSHRLAEQTAQDHPAPSFFAVVANIVRKQPFRPLACSVIYLVTSAPRELTRLGTEMGLASIAFTVSLIVVSMTAFNFTMRRRPQHHAALFLSGIVVIEGLTVVLAPAYTAITGVVVSAADVVGSVIFGIFIIFVTSGFGSWRITRRDMLRTFEQEISHEEVAALARSRAIADAAREAGAVLHGAVQTKLVATAMAIDHGVAAGDMVAVNQALMQARAILEQPLATDAGAAQSTLGSQVQRKASLWRGLADVTVLIDPAIAALTGPVALRAGDIVEEGIANAIHHGGARTISVYAAADDDSLVIRIVDDGAGPAGGPPGLGTRMLSEQAAQWSLAGTAEGTVLTARFDVNSPHSTQDAWA